MENNEIIVNEAMETMENAIEEIAPAATKGNGGLLSFLLGLGVAGAAYGVTKLFKRAKNKKAKKDEEKTVPKLEAPEDDSDAIEQDLPEVE